MKSDLTKSTTTPPFDLDALEVRAVEAIARCYEIEDGNLTARFWVQKGIEGMRLAVAEAMRKNEEKSLPPVEGAVVDNADLCAVHEFGPWRDDSAGVIRECVICGEMDWRPEG